MISSHFNRFVLAALSGLLLAAAHASCPLAVWFAVPALLLSIDRVTPRFAFYCGLTAGSVSTIAVGSIITVSPLSFIAVMLLCALTVALFTCILSTAYKRLTWGLWLAPPLWITLEWLHANIPYSAPSLLGDTQTTGPLLPLARIGGTYLIAFFILAFAVWVTTIIATLTATVASTEKRIRTQDTPLFLPLLQLCMGKHIQWAGVLCVTFFTLAYWTAMVNIPVKIGSLTVNTVQGGLHDSTYRLAFTDPKSFDHPFLLYRDLSLRAPRAQLTIWPETSVPNRWQHQQSDNNLFYALQNKLQGDLLLGVVTQWGQNSSVLLSSFKSPQITHKQRLALFVETQFVPGNTIQIQQTQWATVGTLFCLESMMPQYARALVLKSQQLKRSETQPHLAQYKNRGQGAGQLLVVLAEGTLFGNTPLSWLHARRSIVRAVESGRALVHAGQHGETMWIDVDGSYTPPFKPYIAQVLHAQIPLYTGLTLYGVYGDWIVWLSFMILAWALFVITLKSCAGGATR